jgi:hypothetical protein
MALFWPETLARAREYYECPNHIKYMPNDNKMNENKQGGGDNNRGNNNQNRQGEKKDDKKKDDDKKNDGGKGRSRSAEKMSGSSS